MSRWNGFNQWLYPQELRIETSTADAVSALLVASVNDITRALERAAANTGTASEPLPPLMPPSGGGLDKAFVLDLCNNFHRLCRSAKPLQESGGSQGGRMSRNLDQVRKVLHENGIECVDLTGQVYSPGRADFEPLGEPQPSPGLTHPTIIQCERPLVTLKGTLLQPGKGIVGRPPA